jgi:hypothetical protein
MRKSPSGPKYPGARTSGFEAGAIRTSPSHACRSAMCSTCAIPVNVNRLTVTDGPEVNPRSTSATNRIPGAESPPCPWRDRVSNVTNIGARCPNQPQSVGKDQTVRARLRGRNPSRGCKGADTTECVLPGWLARSTNKQESGLPVPRVVAICNRRRGCESSGPFPGCVCSPARPMVNVLQAASGSAAPFKRMRRRRQTLSMAPGPLPPISKARKIAPSNKVAAGFV